MRRAERLKAARRDEHHWRMALKPAELVDFDLLAVATISTSALQTDEPFADPSEFAAMALSFPCARRGGGVGRLRRKLFSLG